MRWVMSPIIGNGTATIVAGQEATTGPYRAKASDYGAHAALIPGNADGTPVHNWCFVYFDGDVTAANGDAALDVLPDRQPGDVLTTLQRNFLINACTRRGLDSSWVVSGITFGEAVDHIGQLIEAGFTRNWMRTG
jgi:hypothetical protein